MAPAVIHSNTPGPARADELSDYLAALVQEWASAISSGTFADVTDVFRLVQAEEADERLERALRRAELATMDALTHFIREALPMFGLAMRAGLSYLDLSAAIVSAIARDLRTPTNEATSPVVEPQTGCEYTIWTPLGVALLGVVATATEPDPHSLAVSADPSRWFPPPTE